MSLTGLHRGSNLLNALLALGSGGQRVLDDLHRFLEPGRSGTV